MSPYRTPPVWPPFRIAGVPPAALAMLWLAAAGPVAAAEQSGLTTLANSGIDFRRAPGAYVVLRRGAVRAVVVDNSAVDDPVLPGHRAGYSGVAHLSHRHQPRNLFVPAYAGLNFEHIHDGTTQLRDILFEPRRAPMQLRVVDAHTVELYQPPTPTWKLESATRYELLEDGTIQLTFECIPRERTFRNGYIGLFWASYIHEPEDTAIHFVGVPDGEFGAMPRWIAARSPKHGMWATHLAIDDRRRFAHSDDFPLSLVFNRSRYRYAEPWYYGLCRGMALLFVFRPQDAARFAQSPSGGGRGNPAWDFQTFIQPYEPGRLYRRVMRAVYTPYESPQQMARLARHHLQQLSRIP